MELRQVEGANGIRQLETHGNITRDGWAHDYDPFTQVVGSDAYDKSTVLNLEHSDYIDSTGVAWLLTSTNKFRQHGQQLVVHSPKPMVAQLLKLMRMHLSLHIAADINEALKKLHVTDAE